MQLVPPSAAVSPGGLCLPQLAAEWNNHAVTPQEQKGPYTLCYEPIFPFGGVLVTQRVPALNAFSQDWGFESGLWSRLICPLSYTDRPLQEMIHFG